MSTAIAKNIEGKVTAKNAKCEIRNIVDGAVVEEGEIVTAGISASVDIESQDGTIANISNGASLLLDAEYFGNSSAGSVFAINDFGPIIDSMNSGKPYEATSSGFETNNPSQTSSKIHNFATLTAVVEEIIPAQDVIPRGEVTPSIFQYTPQTIAHHPAIATTNVVPVPVVDVVPVPVVDIVPVPLVDVVPVPVPVVDIVPVPLVDVVPVPVPVVDVVPVPVVDIVPVPLVDVVPVPVPVVDIVPVPVVDIVPVPVVDIVPVPVPVPVVDPIHINDLIQHDADILANIMQHKDDNNADKSTNSHGSDDRNKDSNNTDHSQSVDSHEANAHLASIVKHDSHSNNHN